jgi:N-acetylglucosamine PTS system EIICBA or EIICB component
MREYLQRLGRSIMLPVATLPVAAILMGVGYAIDPSGWGGNSLLAGFLIKGGAAILDNLGILFAIGVSLGMVKDKDGSSTMAGLVAFLVILTMLSPGSVSMFRGELSASDMAAFGKVNNGNVFFGILAGLVASALYDRFSTIKLPTALAFFSGRRFVPIITALTMMVVSAVMMFIWPVVFGGLSAFGIALAGMGPLGAGLFGFFNRLLIPYGLHHALNNVFWFDLVGINDIGNFWTNAGIKGITGRYQAGFFPIMMFGLPGGALAMYRAAKPENKKSVASLMIAAATATFMTGVTEPLEFSFMFVAWPLYIVHAVLTGISLFVAAFFQWTAGFNFSAGLIDFVFSLSLPIANQPWMLLVQGLIMFALYYFSFAFAITKFNLMTPGREEAVVGERKVYVGTKDEKTVAFASQLYQLIGGKENVLVIDNCISRLRITVKSSQNINENEIKLAGAAGYRKISDDSIQIIIGTEVQFVADAMNAIHKG